MLALNYNHPIEDTSIFTLDKAIAWVKLLLGSLGLIITSPILLVMFGYTVMKLKQVKKSMKGNLQIIYDSIPTAEETEIIDTHLEIERAKTQFKEVFTRDILESNVALLKPIITEIKEIYKILLESEAILKKAAYPNLNKTPDTQHLEELESLFRSVEDWKDSEMDIYQNYL